MKKREHKEGPDSPEIGQSRKYHEEAWPNRNRRKAQKTARPEKPRGEIARDKNSQKSASGRRPFLSWWGKRHRKGQ